MDNGTNEKKERKEKMTTSTTETKKALDHIINTNGGNEYAKDLFTMYARNDRRLYDNITNSRHRDSFLIWDIVLTTINNEMQELNKYYATAGQVRKIMKKWNRDAKELLEIASEVLKEEREG